jgi:Beta/Gamma crystallin
VPRSIPHVTRRGGTPIRTMAVAGLITLLSLTPWVTAGEPGRAGEMPQIIAFDGAELTGDHTHIMGDIRRLGKWDNSISSLIIVSGTWEFFDDDEFTGTNMAT